MKGQREKEPRYSFIVVVLMALMLPGLLKLANGAIRYMAGAEGRLASITIDSDGELGNMPRVWESLAQGGENLRTFLDGDIGDVIRLKPKYIRIDHIYDEFKVVSRSNGQLIYDWTALDHTVERIASVGAKPFFALSYMPPAISKDGSILAEPNNWKDWEAVVQKTIEHFSGELGIEDVYYEVWNEPDLFGKWTMGGKKDYKVLYMYASRGATAAKNVKPFKIGGPGTSGLYKNWLDRFFPFILSNKLRLDFFSWHRYDLDLTKYAQDIRSVDAWLERHPYFSRVEKIISEMGPNSEMGNENDTHVGAAHTVATAKELLQKVDMGFNFAVNGSWGILGRPRYKALEYLASLPQTRLSLSGEGTWVKAIAAADKNASEVRVILVNYDQKGIHNEVVPVNFTGLKGSKYKLTTELLDGMRLDEVIATTSSLLQYKVPMTANSVARVVLSVLED